MAGRDFYLEVDASELDGLCDRLRTILSAENFDKLMTRTLNEVGKRARTPIKEAARAEYDVKVNWVGRAVKSAHINGGGSYGISCVIPVVSGRGTSGKIFDYGGRASAGYIAKGDIRKVWIRDVRGRKSQLPTTAGGMSAYGGQLPFINKGTKHIQAREGKDRYPIRTITGVAVPQMPLNLARDETERRILELCEVRLMHNFEYMFRTVK